MSFLCAQAYSEEIEPKALYYTGTHQLRQSKGLTAKGVNIATVCRSMTYVDGEPQNDYLWNIGHSCFALSDITLADGLGGISEHATSIGGILTGDDIDGFHPDIGDFHYVGAAPEATVGVYEFWRFISTYASGGKELDTDILTMSVGVIFEDWWTRGIERLAEEQGVVVVAGIGNGSDVCDPPYYPAAGANVIGVGVIDSVNGESWQQGLAEFSLARDTHSSSGPTSDGRCGVDIVAPGNCLVPASSDESGYEATGGWSSFATPIVAGTIGQLIEHAKSDPNLSMAVSSNGGNCVIKAIVLNSARKLPYWHKGSASPDDDHEYSLDFIQGAGSLDAIAAFDQLTAGENETGQVPQIGWDSNLISNSPDTSVSYEFQIDRPADKLITVTLAWNRHYKDEYPFKAAIDEDSDLRVELWAVANDETQTDYLVDHCDSVNDNIEHIYCPADPNFTTYQIVVRSNDVSTDEAEPLMHERYALAWNVRQSKTEKQIEWFDLDGDGSAGTNDIALLMKRIDSSPDSENGYLTGDINLDGIINIKDVAELVYSLDR